MSHNPNRSRFGRTMIITATAIGVTLGAAGLAGAAQSAWSSTSFDSDVALETEVSTPTSDDQATESSTDDSTENSTDDSTAISTDGSTAISTDGSTENSTDDSTENSTDDSVDSDDDSSSNPSAPLPAPFTKVYLSAGGSIAVTWTGTAFVLDTVIAANGYVAEIKDQSWDRIRVDFEGVLDSRIEVRISDDDNSVRVRID
ncbi:MAG: hypothetical protein Q7V57_01180 [Actinomycetota bacterium]|nr:hypothetical protein [Actinomycetota bacterium]